jgi:hypothetical protein
VGNELSAAGLGDGDGFGLALCVAVLGVVVWAVAEVVGVAVSLAEVVGVAEPLAPGANAVGVVDGEPAVQADTDTMASMATAALPKTVPTKRRWP